MTVHGAVDPAFAEVRDAFAGCFAGHGELGAAVAVVVEGRVVAELWGGSTGVRHGPNAWRRDTIVNLYSATKPVVAACLLLLVERGRVDLDARVSLYWPEFAAAGKDEVTVRHVLAHQAGLDLFEPPLQPDALLDWEHATSLLAATAPRWAPGATHGEHAAFYGHLVGELVRRVDGRPVGTFLREELAAPWQLDLHVGLEPGAEARAADVIDPDGAFVDAALGGPRSYVLAVDNPPAMLHPEVVNGRRWRRASVPAVNGHGTALALARFYAGLAAGGVLDGVRLLSPELVDEATARPQRIGVDEVLGREVGWGLGPQIDDDGFGLGGIGGTGGWWNRRGFAFGYVTRRLGTHDRAVAVEEAVIEALER